MSGHLPNVGRPKGGLWRRLQDEGIVWEGQILITGEDTDLAALLIVTNERLAFVRGGVIALDIERDWLDPAPVLRRTGTVQVWISPPEDPVAESLTFIARDGRDEAAVLLSMIGDRGAYGSAYRMPAYIPEKTPQEPQFPIARSRATMPREDSYDLGYDPPRAFYSTLDDDDFPPVEAGTEMPPWEEAIAEALEPTSVIPIAGSLRQPNDPLRPIEGFDSKFARDRRSWVIRLVGLFLLVGFGSVIASGILPGPDDLRDLIDDDPTEMAVAQIDSATSTPTTSPDEIGAEPTTQPTKSGPSSSAPKDPTVVPIETAVSLGVGGDNTQIPPTPTKEPTATATLEQPSSNDGVQSSQEAPAETATTEETAVIPAADEPAPTATATTEPTEEPTNEATLEPAATTEPGQVDEEPGTTEAPEDPESTSVLMEGLELEIDEVHRGERLPDLTLGRNSIGEWVVVLVQVSNVSSEPVELAMDDIRLAPADDLQNEVALDPASSAVASFLGMNPTVRSDASATISPGGIQPLALVFSIPLGLGDLMLLTGDESFSLQQGSISGFESTADYWGTTAVVFDQPTSLLATDLVAESSGWPARSATGSGLAGWLSGESIAADASGELEWSSKAARERFKAERGSLHV